MPFAFQAHEFPGVVLIEARTIRDDRGWFREMYRRSAFEQAGIRTDLRQENLAASARRGTLRGLHYQADPAAQAKLITCVRGAIHDVAVDLRRGSARYGQWFALELTGNDGTMLWLPEGFAHGYQTLADDTLLAYRTSAEYSPAHERGIRWDDPALAIRWPIAEAIISARDQALPTLAQAGIEAVHPT